MRQTVQVHYTPKVLNFGFFKITSIDIVNVRVEPDATTQHIKEHLATINYMCQYQGFSGRMKAFGDQFKKAVGWHGKPAIGTALWEAKKEVEKLSSILIRRANAIERGRFDVSKVGELEAELELIAMQLSFFEGIVKSVDAKVKGRGYVAMDSTIDKMHRAVVAGFLIAYNKDIPPNQNFAAVVHQSKLMEAMMRNISDVNLIKYYNDLNKSPLEYLDEGQKQFVISTYKQDQKNGRKSSVWITNVYTLLNGGTVTLPKTNLSKPNNKKESDVHKKQNINKRRVTQKPEPEINLWDAWEALYEQLPQDVLEKIDEDFFVPEIEDFHKEIQNGRIDVNNLQDISRAEKILDSWSQKWRFSKGINTYHKPYTEPVYFDIHPNDKLRDKKIITFPFQNFGTVL